MSRIPNIIHRTRVIQPDTKLLIKCAKTPRQIKPWILCLLWRKINMCGARTTNSNITMSWSKTIRHRTLTLVELTIFSPNSVKTMRSTMMRRKIRMNPRPLRSPWPLDTSKQTSTWATELCLTIQTSNKWITIRNRSSMCQLQMPVPKSIKPDLQIKIHSKSIIKMKMISVTKSTQVAWK